MRAAYRLVARPVPRARTLATAVAAQPPAPAEVEEDEAIVVPPVALKDSARNYVSFDVDFPGMAREPFSPEIVRGGRAGAAPFFINSPPLLPQANVLLAPLDPKDVEIKPDGIIYLPEIKYRRILNRAFGPGAWALVPRGDSLVSGKHLSRDFNLFCMGRFVAQARGDHEAFTSGPMSLGMAEESAKSNALMRTAYGEGVGEWRSGDLTLAPFFAARISELRLSFGILPTSLRGRRSTLWLCLRSTP